ncbi:MAG: NAD(P)H-dependent glycerol-3-phosphate dehydrogenase [Vicinamibacterales bacterium]
MKPTAILGAGSWGTALAIHLANAGHGVRLWARDPAFVEELRSTRRNTRYLPDARFPDGVEPVASLDAALDGAGFVVGAVPSHGLRTVIRSAAPHIEEGAILVSATKGLESDTLLRMSEVLETETGWRFPTVVLSGPSFAAEVARGLPTALLAASVHPDAATAVQACFRGRGMRLYVSDDVAGVEIGGALKNVIAIAAGVVEGLGLGHNATAALITRGLAEISRLACAEGARRETLAGLSGLGDLVLTCTGDLSRNRRVGIELGRGRPLEEILSGMRMVAEGVRTTGASLALGVRHGIELPIAAQMNDVLESRCSPADGVDALMGRRQRAEVDG